MSWGQFLGELTSGMASASQYQASKHERNIAWKRAQQWELMAPTLRMEGLRNAGINPILAGGDMSGGLNQPRMGDTGGGVKFRWDPQAAASAKQITALTPSVVRAAEANASEAEWRALAAKYLPEKSFHDAGAAGEYWNLLSEQTMNTRANTGYVDSQKNYLGVNTRLLESQLPSAKALEELYSKYPLLRQIGAALKEVR